MIREIFHEKFFGFRIFFTTIFGLEIFLTTIFGPKIFFTTIFDPEFFFRYNFRPRNFFHYNFRPRNFFTTIFGPEIFFTIFHNFLKFQLSIGVAVFCLPWLRWKQPELIRPIRVHLIFPIVYIICTIFVTIFPMIEKPAETGKPKPQSPPITKPWPNIIFFFQDTVF